MQVIHVVGVQGVGRTTLVESMAARAEARGLRTGHVLEGSGPVSRADAIAMFPAVDVLYIERYRREDVGALPGELVITMERATEPLVGEGA